MVLLLKNLLFTVVVPGTVAVYIPLTLIGQKEPATGMMVVVAIPLLALGVVMYAWCVWDFASFGQGTPAPIDAPQKLVVRGLYKYTRNPMYVSVLTVILGLACLFRSSTLLWYALAVGTFFHLFIVLYEEVVLREEFGAAYDTYRSHVGRWIPRGRQ